MFKVAGRSLIGGHLGDLQALKSFYAKRAEISSRLQQLAGLFLFLVLNSLGIYAFCLYLGPDFRSEYKLVHENFFASFSLPAVNFHINIDPDWLLSSILQIEPPNSADLLGNTVILQVASILCAALLKVIGRVLCICNCFDGEDTRGNTNYSTSNVVKNPANREAYTL